MRGLETTRKRGSAFRTETVNWPLPGLVVASRRDHRRWTRLVTEWQPKEWDVPERTTTRADGARLQLAPRQRDTEARNETDDTKSAAATRASEGLGVVAASGVAVRVAAPVGVECRVDILTQSQVGSVIRSVQGSEVGGSDRAAGPAGAAALTAPPCLACLPLLGSLHVLAGHGALHLALHELAKRHGPVFALRLGAHRALAVCALGPAREVLLRKGRAFAGRARMVSTDLVSHGGRDIAFADASPAWRFHRKVVHSALYGARPPGEDSLHDIGGRRAHHAALTIPRSPHSPRPPHIHDANIRTVILWTMRSQCPQFHSAHSGLREEEWTERGRVCCGAVSREARGLVDSLEAAGRGGARAVDPEPLVARAVTAAMLALVFGAAGPGAPGAPEAEVERVLRFNRGIVETAARNHPVDLFPWLQVFPIAHLRRLRACVAVRDNFLQQKLSEHKVTVTSTVNFIITLHHHLAHVDRAHHRARSCQATGPEHGARALLSLLLEARREAERGEESAGESAGESARESAGGGEPSALQQHARRLTDDHVMMTVADVFGAGVETTVTSLRWLLAYLVHHPEVQARVHAELDVVVGTERAPRASDRTALPQLAATILETQRVRPVAPLLIPHVAMEDTSVGNFAVAKGTRVLVNMWSIHHDETAWPDPERFDPGRFLHWEGGRLQAGAPEGSSFLPFGGGPRVCLGEPLARLQLLLMSAALLQRFRFEAPRSGVGGALLLPDLAGECGVVLHPRPYLLHAVPRPPPQVVGHRGGGPRS
uniref:Steroid 17-alpha-hydroxylase/17,20 lyase n=1 Tax=Petromyzon marinus TaxID=7757 RepID=A0AAJ7T1H9_PETMA|nr:steroid 17-alpha-hydroxylase/17,20 lyase [Petromyzon marinus]